MPVEQVRRRQRHERILDAALSVFSRKGYHLAAVDDIAVASETSKGGVYFHFPTKQALFLALLDRMAALLRTRIEAAVADEADPIAKADIALQVVLQTFASHRTLSRLFFVEALGAGPDLALRMAEIRSSFVDLIRQHLDEAVRQGSIPALDTRAASRVWFGALNEVVTTWVLSEPPGRLEDSYPTVRALLLRGIGAQVPLPAAAPVPAAMPRSRANGTPPVSDADAVARAAGDAARAAIESALARARPGRPPVLASVTLPAPGADPVSFFANGTLVYDERRLWSRPRTGFALAGLGVVAAIETNGTDAIARANVAWQQLVHDAVVDAPVDTIGVGPVAIGGFAFDPESERTPRWEGFPDGRLVLPRFVLTHVDGSAWLTINTLVPPDLDVALEAERVRAAVAVLLAPAADAAPGVAARVVDDGEGPASRRWKGAVRTVAERVAAGELEKAVLARTCSVQSDGPIPLVPALRRLQHDYPSCFVFAIARGERCFLGATPERLVRLRDGVVSTMCLAGSIGRGTTEAEDRRLGEALLSSAKDRAEHQVVVHALQEALAEVCDQVAPTSTPVLLKVKNVQHLLTTVVGRVVDGRSILDVVERLHPTPAVGGYPTQTALRLIRSLEGLDRGWYAGPVGWVDAGGEGELAVAIRSALVAGAEATLFAGCGIVADSDPEAEYEESRLKLRPVLAALGAAGG